MAQEDRLWRLENEAVCRYHRQRESLERREDALRARERHLDRAAGEFLWDVGRCRAMVDDMLDTVPCVAHQAAYAADVLASVQNEASARLDERHTEIARERRDLDEWLERAEEEFHRSLQAIRTAEAAR